MQANVGVNIGHCYLNMLLIDAICHGKHLSLTSRNFVLICQNFSWIIAATLQSIRKNKEQWKSRHSLSLLRFTYVLIIIPTMIMVSEVRSYKMLLPYARKIGIKFSKQNYILQELKQSFRILTSWYIRKYLWWFVKKPFHFYCS